MRVLRSWSSLCLLPLCPAPVLMNPFASSLWRLTEFFNLFIDLSPAFSEAAREKAADDDCRRSFVHLLNSIIFYNMYFFLRYIFLHPGAGWFIFSTVGAPVPQGAGLRRPGCSEKRREQDRQGERRPAEDFFYELFDIGIVHGLRRLPEAVSGFRHLGREEGKT